ncbi:MAG: NADH-quinone oxidoreductase subunit A [Ignavibacteria bacterium]
MEIVFLYPWAVAFGKFDKNVLLYAVIEMFVFIAILLVGYFYMLRKGALKWD